MAQRISDMTPLSALDEADQFEVARKKDGISYSVTPEVIKEYVKNSNNGAFRGDTHDSLDSLLNKDCIGIWRWTSDGGNVGPNGLASGIVEVISGVSPDDNPDDYIQRISFGAFVYQRTVIDNVASAWASISNVNGCRIQYNVANTDTVTFPVPFKSAPAVTCVPTYSTATSDDGTVSPLINIVNIVSVTQTGFTVSRYSSNTAAAYETETISTTGTEQTTTTKTHTVHTQGKWKTDGDFSYYWIAVLEEG